MLKSVVLATLLCFCSFSMMAQAPAPASSVDKGLDCQDPYLHSEMVEFNSEFFGQGYQMDLFQIVRFPKKAVITIKVHLEQGRIYQINYVLNRDFTNASIALVSKEKKEVFKDSYRGKNEVGHWFGKSIVAPYTGEYWFVLTQKASGKDMICGGLSILKVEGL